MMSDEEKSLLSVQREALREYLGGRRNGPFVIDRNDAYPVDAVICPSLTDRLGLSLRFVILWIAGATPVCGAKILLYRLAGVKMGKNVCISPGVVIDPLFPSLIELEDDCCLGMGCRLLTHEFTATTFRIGQIRIGKGSVIGVCSTVRCGTTIGEKVTVGANSFVNRDVPDGQVVGGVPARPLSRREEGK